MIGDTFNFMISFIHFLSGILWWGITFFVVFILSPVNKKGIFSSLLPRVHKFVIFISTITIISGIFLILITFNFDFFNLFSSSRGQTILIGGTFSIPVYVTVVFRSRKRNIVLKMNKRQFVNNFHFLPYFLFALLSITLGIMIFISQWF
jgi:hypothetical protein